MLYDWANVFTGGAGAKLLRESAAAAGRPTAEVKSARQSGQALAGQLNFLPQAAAQWLTGKDARGWDITNYKSNEIPAWMMKTPGIAGFTRVALITELPKGQNRKKRNKQASE